ncbi:MAG: hypothetical protein LOD87_06785 [Planifilum fulgidum]
MRSERVELEVDGRRFLHEANRDKWPPERLFRVMAQHVPKLYVPYLLTNTGKKRPLVSPGPSPKSQRMILFTDPEPAKLLRVDQSLTLVERKALDLLRKAFRSDYAGLVINPGDSSRRVLNREEMLLLFREYAVIEGRRLGGGWVPTRGDKMLLVQLEDGTYTVTVYIDERDVREVCDSCGGEPVLHSWDVIHNRCLQAGASAPYVQFGFPEQVLLLPRHMNQLRGQDPVAQAPEWQPSPEAVHSQKQASDWQRSPEPVQPREQASERPETPESAQPQEQVADWQQATEQVQPRKQAPEQLQSLEPAQPQEQAPERPQEQEPVRVREKERESPESRETKESLERLEQAVRRGQGWVNTLEIIRRMKELRKIWVIVDPDGKPVFLDSGSRVPVVDFFTSRDHAVRLIQVFRQGGKELPDLEPRLVDARPLFKRLAAYNPVVWINRGAPEGWICVSDHLLSAVLAESFTDSGVFSEAEQ